MDSPPYVATIDVTAASERLPAHVSAKWSEWLTGPSFGAGSKVLTAKWVPPNVIANPSGYFVMGSPCVALLAVPSSPSQYLNTVGPKTRNMISKARRRSYYHAPFVWNERLADIHEVNTSKPVRQGKPMSRAYKAFPQQSAEAAYAVRTGVFLEDTLVAYAKCVRMHQLSIIVTIIGHADHLTHGVMNMLVYGIVSQSIGTDVTHINYLTLPPNSSLSSFKRRVGFRPYTCFVKKNGYCTNIKGGFGG
jgi:hypothetical protein